MDRIFTNNPDVRDKYGTRVHFVDGGVRAVFVAVRDAVHAGARVLSHPLSGSVKPWVGPYKSVAVCVETGAPDFTSLRLIEDALGKLRTSAAGVAYNTAVLADFRLIDLDLIDFAMESIQGGALCTIS